MCSQVGETRFDGGAYLHRAYDRRRENRLSVWSRRFCCGCRAKLSLLVSALRFFHAIPITLAPVPLLLHTTAAARTLYLVRVFKCIKKNMQNSKNRYILRKGIRHGGSGLFVKGRDTGTTPKGKRFKRTLI